MNEENQHLHIPAVISRMDEKNHIWPVWVSPGLIAPEPWSASVCSYRDGSMKYDELLDGGLVDNFGLSGFTIALESAQTSYDPLSRAEAVRLRRVPGG